MFSNLKLSNNINIVSNNMWYSFLYLYQILVFSFFIEGKCKQLQCQIILIFFLISKHGYIDSWNATTILLVNSHVGSESYML